jgi:hypothetical protein
MEQVSWQELSSILREYEEKHNHDTLKTFTTKYYPTATRVEVESFSEYDDSNYYQTYSVSSTRFYQEEERLEPPRDGEALARLISSSDALRADFEEAKPIDPLTWFEEQYYGDFCDLNLYGPEHGDDLMIDLTSPLAEPTPLYRMLNSASCELPTPLKERDTDDEVGLEDNT